MRIQNLSSIEKSKRTHCAAFRRVITGSLGTRSARLTFIMGVQRTVWRGNYTHNHTFRLVFLVKASELKLRYVSFELALVIVVKYSMNSQKGAKSSAIYFQHCDSSPNYLSKSVGIITNDFIFKMNNVSSEKIRSSALFLRLSILNRLSLDSTVLPHPLE